MTTFRMAFVSLSIAWAVMLPVAAFAASRPRPDSTRLGDAFAFIVYDIGRLICHQRPERSFFPFGAQLPVCARCAGIYGGAALMAVVALAWAHSTRRLVMARPVLLAAAVPTVVTLLYEWTSGQTPGHWVRALSGAPLGAAVAWIVCAAATPPRPRGAT